MMQLEHDSNFFILLDNKMKMIKQLRPTLDARFL